MTTLPDPDQSLSIVMAAYNEQDALPRCVPRAVEFLRKHVECGELIIVNDGSTDETPRIIDELADREPEIRAFHLEKNSGMGAALLRGYGEAQNEWVTLLPADGQLDPFELLDFFKVAHDADLITSLYRNRKYTLTRKVLSLGLRALTTVIIGNRAQSEGLYLIRRTVLEELKPQSPSFLLNLEIPIRAKREGYRVKTIFMNVSDRIAGESKAATPGRIARTFVDQFSLRVALEKERFGKILGEKWQK